MDLAAANLLATLLTTVAATTLAAWYLSPALRTRPLAGALTLLIWPHAFRYVALQIFSAAQVGGLDAPTAAQRTIAFGDLATAILALITLWALHAEVSAARTLVWIFVAIGAADLVSATIVGIDNQLTDTASNLSWLILAFYVPILWITAIMLVYQLASRRHEALAGTSRPQTSG